MRSRFFFFLSFVNPIKKRKAVARHVAVASDRKRHFASRFLLVRCFFAPLTCSIE